VPRPPAHRYARASVRHSGVSRRAQSAGHASVRALPGCSSIDRLCLGKQLFDDFLVAVKALGLKKGTLVIVETGPLQPVEDLLNGLGGRALQVRVFDSQDELSSVTARVQPAKQRRAQAANVQEAGRTGRKTGSDNHRPKVSRTKKGAQSLAEAPWKAFRLS